MQFSLKSMHFFCDMTIFWSSFIVLNWERFSLRVCTLVEEEAKTPKSDVFHSVVAVPKRSSLTNPSCFQAKGPAVAQRGNTWSIRYQRKHESQVEVALLGAGRLPARCRLESAPIPLSPAFLDSTALEGISGREKHLINSRMGPRYHQQVNNEFNMGEQGLLYHSNHTVTRKEIYG